MSRFVGRSPWKSRGITGYAKRTARAMTRRNLDWHTSFDTECSDDTLGVDQGECPAKFAYDILDNATLRGVYEGAATVLRTIVDLYWYIPAVYDLSPPCTFNVWPHISRAGIRKYTANETSRNLFSLQDVSEAHYDRILQQALIPRGNGTLLTCGPEGWGGTLYIGTPDGAPVGHWKIDDKRAHRLTGDESLRFDWQMRYADPAGLASTFPSGTPGVRVWGFIKTLVAT